MNNLSCNDIQAQIVSVENLAKTLKWESVQDAQKLLAVADSLRELLALREAGKEPVAATMFKPVADLFAFKAPGCREWSFTDDAEGIPEMVRRGWPVREYVTLERFQQSYAAPQLPAVPEGAEQRLAAAVELLKQAAPHMLADESLKDPDGALCGKVPAVPELIPVPDEFLSAEQNQRGMFELGEDCMVRLSSALAQQSKGLVVPPDWVMVPVEPTEDMVISGFESDPEIGLGSDTDAQEAYEAMSGCQQAAHRAKLCWAAMIAAAPKPE